MIELLIGGYIGGIVCMSGNMLAGMQQDPDIESAGVLDVIYCVFACLLWPGFIVQMMVAKDDDADQ